ncbi:hypothetical protein V6N13_014245 [Hibiscus sabdariffa]
MWDLCLYSHEAQTTSVCMLDGFYELLGLKLNASKSELFISGDSTLDLEEIHVVFVFKVVLLPIRYLGIPLVTRKLSRKDCNVLIAKVKARLHLGARQVLVQASCFA